jgi:biotin transporter BioY
LLKLLQIALVTSFTALGAFVALPLPFLVWGSPALPGASEWVTWRNLSLGLFYPSAQLLGVWLAGTWLGMRAGTFAMAVYLALGFFGLPVFINGGGLAYGQHASLVPLLVFPPAAWLIARLQRHGGAKATFRALFAGSMLVSGSAVVSGVAGSGLWFAGRQWLELALPHIQALLGWTLAMVLWAMVSGVVYRFQQVFAPAAPPVEKEPAAGTSPLSLPSGRPRDQRALPPAIAQNAKQLPAPPKSLPPGRSST